MKITSINNMRFQVFQLSCQNTLQDSFCTISWFSSRTKAAQKVNIFITVKPYQEKKNWKANKRTYFLSCMWVADALNLKQSCSSTVNKRILYSSHPQHGQAHKRSSRTEKCCTNGKLSLLRYLLLLHRIYLAFTLQYHKRPQPQF